MSSEYWSDFQSYQPTLNSSTYDLASDDTAGYCGAESQFGLTPATWPGLDVGSYGDGGLPYLLDANRVESATPPGGVDISRNDVTMTLGALVNFVPALLVRGAMALVPGLASDFLPDHRSVFGTADKTGAVGWLVGDSNAGSGMPGVLGIAASLAGWQGIFGNFEKFEEGGRRHNLNTGSGRDSQTFSSIGETLGQGVGVLARNLGIGSFVESMVTSIFGESDGYGFVNGVQSGSWINIGFGGDSASG